MPESPEVQALVEFLDDRLVGSILSGVDVLEFRAVKTRTHTPDTLVGELVVGVHRYGKHLAIDFGTAQLVVSLGRHGWMRWRAADASALAEEPPALAELSFDNGDIIEVTDAGSWVSIGLSVVDAAREVDAIAKLGPDPLDTSFDRAAFDRAFGMRRKQIKAILQEQESCAGIGNAYSDEILHVAELSPTTHAAALGSDARTRLFDATVATLRDAADEQRGVPIHQLKAAKVASMRVHGRAGEECPRCGSAVEDLAFGGTTAQWCPACQL